MIHFQISFQASKQYKMTVPKCYLLASVCLLLQGALAARCRLHVDGEFTQTENDSGGEAEYVIKITAEGKHTTLNLDVSDDEGSNCGGNTSGDRYFNTKFYDVSCNHVGVNVFAYEHDTGSGNDFNMNKSGVVARGNILTLTHCAEGTALKVRFALVQDPTGMVMASLESLSEGPLEFIMPKRLPTSKTENHQFILRGLSSVAKPKLREVRDN